MFTKTAAVVMFLLAAADAEWVKQVEAWRAKHEADYTRDYVPLAGLAFLKDGVNTAGSATSSQVVLPRRLPASVGRFVNQGGRVTFEPAAAGVTLNGKARGVAGADALVEKPIALRSDGDTDGPDRLGIGDVSFWVHTSGDRLAIRIHDPQSTVAKAFAGYRWFPIDEKYRVVGRFIKDATPREVKIPTLVGDYDLYRTEGVVEFTLLGQTIRMRPMTTRPGRLYFIFRDGTSGKETYEAARFLYSDLSADGTTVLDFNQAYNPPCSFNPYTTCPIPPAENRPTVRILAGERDYAGTLPNP
jgi:uncharacterized protein (DUF1684 family)